MGILGNTSTSQNGAAYFTSAIKAGRYTLVNGVSYFIALFSVDAVGVAYLNLSSATTHYDWWASLSGYTDPKIFSVGGGATFNPSIYLTYSGTQMVSVTGFIANNTVEGSKAQKIQAAVYRSTNNGDSPDTAVRVAVSAEVQFPQSSELAWYTIPISGTIDSGVTYPTDAITRVTGIKHTYKNALINGGKTIYRNHLFLGGLAYLPTNELEQMFEEAQPIWNQNNLRNPATDFGGFPTFGDYINNIAKQRAGLPKIGDQPIDRSKVRFPWDPR